MFQTERDSIEKISLEKPKVQKQGRLVTVLILPGADPKTTTRVHAGNSGTAGDTGRGMGQ